jgi:hypothetical protein
MTPWALVRATRAASGSSWENILKEIEMKKDAVSNGRDWKRRNKQASASPRQETKVFVLYRERLCTDDDDEEAVNLDDGQLDHHIYTEDTTPEETWRHNLPHQFLST